MFANNIARLSFSTSKDKVTSTKRINLEENAVVTAIIDNGAITTDKLADGAVTLDKITTGLSAGVVHSDASGVLTSSLILNADISSSAAIADSKLATISTSGKVANSATTAISANTASAIVARDASGNFSAGTITVTGERITSFSTGVVHSDASGNLSSSLILNDDISSSAAITDSKLATISTSGKVLNSATTATTSNTANTIVARDASGNILGNTQPLNTSNKTMATTEFVKNAFDDLKAGVGTAYDTLKEIGDALDANITAEAAIINTLSEKANSASPTFTGTIKTALTTGVVHSDASGVLTSSLIVNNDIDANAAIADSKLATISTSGKVSNFATTATHLNTANAIVSRDASGNFSAGNITVTGETISSFTTAGVVHNNASGILSSSLITNADITDGTITSAKLAAAPGGFITAINPTAITSNSTSVAVTVDPTNSISYTFIELTPGLNNALYTLSTTNNVLGKILYLFNSTTAGNYAATLYVPSGTTLNGATVSSNTLSINKGKLALLICYKVNGSNGTWFATVI